MNTTALIKCLLVFTFLSILLGLGSATSPLISELGWAIGTFISILGGVAYGRSSDSWQGAAGGGAIVGSVSIALGCLIPYFSGTLPVQGLIAATVVGAVAGLVAGPFAQRIGNKPRG